MGSNWPSHGPFAGRLIAVLTLPLAMYLLYATGQRALESYRLSREVDHVRAEIATLRLTNLELQREIERRRGDAFIEKVAREELGLVKPGDKALVVVPPVQTSLPAEGPGSQPEVSFAPAPRWSEWRRFFFGT